MVTQLKTGADPGEGDWGDP